MRFEDRGDAGRRLAAALPQFRDRPDTVVLGLARGGVPVAAAVSAALHLPFGALLVRKLGIPGHEETAYGALALSAQGSSAGRGGSSAGDAAGASAGGSTGASAGGRIVRMVNKPLLAKMLAHGIRREWLDGVESRERAELLRRAGSYPGLRHDLRGKTVILVDDGLATGATMRAAVEAARGAGASTVVAAVPVASLEAHTSISRAADSVLSLHLPGHFRAVGSFYRNFDQTRDEEVIGLLRRGQG